MNDLLEDRDRGEFCCHIRHFLREFAFIKELHPVVQEVLADIICHAKCSANQILFEKDEEPNELFIVLSGEVDVLRTLEDPDMAPRVKVMTKEGTRLARRHANAVLKMLVENSLAPQMQGATPPEKTLPPRLLKPPAEGSVRSTVLTATLRPGCMFGEAGLLQDIPRDVTCVCSNECELLMIKKSDLLFVIKDEMNKHRFRQLASPLRQLLRDCNFYKDLDPEVQAQVPEIFRHVRFREDQIVFKQGQPATCCYIVLRGQVSCWRSDIFNDGPIDMGSPSGKSVSRKIADKESSLKFKCATLLARLEEAEYRDQFYEQHIVGGSDEDEDLNEPREGRTYYDLCQELGLQVATLGEGAIFGELGLISEKPRNASVYCNTDCDFLTLSKDDFNRVLRKHVASSQMSLPTLVAPLIRQVPFYRSSLRPNLLESVPYMMRYSLETKGSVLFWEDDPPGSCYLIITGEVTIWKKNTDAPPAPDDMAAITGEVEVCTMCEEIGPQLGDAAPVPKKVAPVAQIRNNIRRVSALPRSSTMDMFGKQVLHLGSGCVFGEQALVNDAPRNATITCRTDCQLLTIERSVFETMLLEDMLKSKVKQLSSTVTRLLKEFQMFSDLPQVVLEIVPDIVTFIAKPRGTCLFEEGDPPGQCFIVLSGEVTVWTSCLERPEGTRRISSGFRPSLSPTRRHSEKQIDASGKTIIPAGYCLDPVSGEIHKPRPPLVPTSLAACEKCAALASMFRSTLPAPKSRKSLPIVRDDIIAEDEDLMDDSAIEENSDPIASLGPGNLFGELALLNDNPRSATVSCRENCEFLVIERGDFDRVIKEEMKRSKDEKLAFLKDYMPGVKKLQNREAERLLYYFNKVGYPRHHVFFEQGRIMDGAIYCVWQGSVEMYCQEEDPSMSNGTSQSDTKFRRLGILLRGSVFGAVPQNTRATYTVIAASAPCEVLLLAPDAREHLPNSLMYALRDHLDMTVSRRREQCAPLSPMGGFLPSQKASRPVTGLVKGGDDVRRAGTSLPRARSVKMPRPLSGKLPSCTGRPSPEACKGIAATKMGARPTTTFGGLFQRWSTSVDYEEFDMDPGEVLALTARKPNKRRDRSREQPAAGMTGSSSLPSLHAA